MIVKVMGKRGGGELIVRSKCKVMLLGIRRVL